MTDLRSHETSLGIVSWIRTVARTFGGVEDTFEALEKEPNNRMPALEAKAVLEDEEKDGIGATTDIGLLMNGAKENGKEGTTIFTPNTVSRVEAVDDAMGMKTGIKLAKIASVRYENYQNVPFRRNSTNVRIRCWYTGAYLDAPRPPKRPCKCLQAW